MNLKAHMTTSDHGYPHLNLIRLSRVCLVLILFPLLVINSCVEFCNSPKDNKGKLQLRPGPAEGKDATLWSCMPEHNFGGDIDIEAMAWTWYSLGLSEGILRGIFEFDLSSLPPLAQIDSARLSLYNNPGSSENDGEHSKLSGSNLAVLQRIIEHWEEDVVTWNSQPNTTAQNETYLTESYDPHQDYINIDVTQLVRDMAEDPANSYGFLLKLENERFYRAMIFASSDHINKNVRPLLDVYYSVHE